MPAPMPQSPAQQWFPIAERAVEGLGHAELHQSYSSPCEFRAVLVLNSYESNCLRDWLALRWKAQSMQNTSVVEKTSAILLVRLTLNAGSIQEATHAFSLWLGRVATERTNALQSRA